MDITEKCAYALEKYTMQSTYGWDDQTFDVWWFEDPYFISKKTSWGYFTGTRKEKCIHDAKLLIETYIKESKNE